MHDALDNGVQFRAFNVIDDFNREGLNITIGTSITSTRVIGELEKLIEWRGKPSHIRVDNVSEFIATTSLKARKRSLPHFNIIYI